MPKSDHLVEIFVPLTYGDGGTIDASVLSVIRDELVDKFGGATVYSRQTAEGSWKGDAGVEREPVHVIEVVVDKVDKNWWKDFRQRLESLLRQQELMIRATRISRL